MFFFSIRSQIPKTSQKLLILYTYTKWLKKILNYSKTDGWREKWMILLNCLELCGTWHRNEKCFFFQHKGVWFQKATHLEYIQNEWRKNAIVKSFTSTKFLGSIRLDSPTWGISTPHTGQKFMNSPLNLHEPLGV